MKHQIGQSNRHERSEDVARDEYERRHGADAPLDDVILADDEPLRDKQWERYQARIQREKRSER